MEKVHILKKVLGKITQVDLDTLILETANGLTQIFRIDPNVEVTDENFHSLQLSGLKRGQRAVVSYSAESGGPFVAKMVMSFIGLRG